MKQSKPARTLPAAKLGKAASLGLSEEQHESRIDTTIHPTPPAAPGTDAPGDQIVAGEPPPTGEVQGKVAEAVQAEQQWLLEVLNLLPAYVVLLTADYHVSFANRFFEEHFGNSNGRRCY